MPSRPYLYLGPGRDFVYGDRGIGAGDFRILARLSLHKAARERMPDETASNAAFCFSGGDAWEQEEGELRVSGFLPPEVRRHSRTHIASLVGRGNRRRLTDIPHKCALQQLTDDTYLDKTPELSY